MITVLAVNNYPTRERFERLEKCLEENGAKVTSIEWNQVSADKFDSFDGVVLSGSPDMISEEKTQAKFRAEVDAIVDSDVPALGICFGHQMMAYAFGARVVKDGRHVLGMMKTRAVADDQLFDGLPESMTLLESRWEVVRALPERFRLLACSKTSKIATMKHSNRLLYGVQFHPERYTKANPDGNRVVANFVRLLK